MWLFPSDIYKSGRFGLNRLVAFCYWLWITAVESAAE
jgi:hypothetical protein